MEKNSKGFIWNTLGSGMFAANSVLLLLIVSQQFGVAAAGDFGIAFTTAQILYIIGLFGINHFQMTDYAQQYSFKSYWTAKWVTTAVMLLSCVPAALFYTKSNEQFYLLLLLTLYMAVHSFAELYQSMFFQKGRLDLSGKSLFYRTFFSLLCFAILSFTVKNLYLASAGMAVTNLLTLYIWGILPAKTMQNKEKTEKKVSLVPLFRTTISLFFSLFLMNILANLSKYVVNYYESSTTQGYFNILFLPTMVINLLSGFIFKPLLIQYTDLAQKEDFFSFKKMYWQHVFMIFALTIVCCLAGYFIGTPILGLVYGVDLSPFRLELVGSILAGGFIAAASFSYYLLVMLRKQVWIFFNYAVNILLGIGISIVLVKNFSISGGVLSMLVSHALLFFVFVGLISYSSGRMKNA